MPRYTIEWTEMSWNPTTGCNKVWAECKFCYAECMSKRLKAMGQQKYQNGFQFIAPRNPENALQLKEAAASVCEPIKCYKCT